MGWKADSLHFVSFASSPSAPDALQPWQRVFGGSPQQLHNAPIGQAPFSMAAGPVGDFQFVINSNPGRIELVLSSAAQPNKQPEAIIEWNAALDVLGGHAVALSAQMGANRVAIVANFSEHADTPKRAAEVFKNRVHLSSMPDAAVDLNFGFNLARNLKSSAGEMNRLCRWGTGTQHIFGMQMTGPTSLPIVSMQAFHVTTLQVDVNTSLIDLSSDDLRLRVIDELSEEIEAIAAGGYDYISK